jgi:GNAT superfamily N-acetyltransferase
MMNDIRTATPDDLDALQALQWRSLRLGLGAAPSPALEASLWRLSGLAAHHVAARACLVAEGGEAGPLGFIAWQAEPLHRGGLPREALPPLPAACGRSTTLRALHVVAEAGLQGIGRALLREAERRLADLGVETVEALVPVAAEAFFRRHGYVAISVHATRLPGGDVLELRRMLRALPEGHGLKPHGAVTARARAAARRG